MKRGTPDVPEQDEKASKKPTIIGTPSEPSAPIERGENKPGAPPPPPPPPPPSTLPPASSSPPPSLPPASVPSASAPESSELPDKMADPHLSSTPSFTKVKDEKDKKEVGATGSIPTKSTLTTANQEEGDGFEQVKSSNEVAKAAAAGGGGEDLKKDSPLQKPTGVDAKESNKDSGDSSSPQPEASSTSPQTKPSPKGPGKPEGTGEPVKTEKGATVGQPAGKLNPPFLGVQPMFRNQGLTPPLGAQNPTPSLGVASLGAAAPTAARPAGMTSPGVTLSMGPNVGGHPPVNVQRQLGVEDALAYLDKVKRQFHDRQEVYNQFLEIMKNFKSHTIDTPGVINHVCELFKGHDNLILGFNTFLPPGFKIELPNRGPGGSSRPVVTQTQPMPGFQNPAQPQPSGFPTAGAIQPPGGRKGGRGRGRGVGGAANAPKGPAVGMGRGLQVQPGQVESVMPTPMHVIDDTVATAGPQGQPVEFDHAINYVTEIKMRFSSETETYKTFLDILHSYQNEQRSIKEVLEQVSELFKDHPDLLEKFTHFLPDAVRESAKTELAKRAAKAQKAAQRAKKMAKNKKGAGPIAEPDHDETRVPQLERNLLGRIKAALGTRELWAEFLKCLDLFFAQELISRAELLALVSDIFGERADLLEEFDRLLASRGATSDPVESAWFSMPLTDIDFANCRRCTPSYRALPAAYPKAPCSERTAMCRSVLNDTWVSVPMGSEDSSSKTHRRNQYEDGLFKCEDDRYEVDMIIDSNKSAIRALEPLAREIETLSLNNGQVAKFRYRLEKRTLSVIHLKAIARIYGDHGTEILELLRRNPAGAIPIILKRLKEKDEEWCRERNELNKGWKEAMEKNYLKSLDHRSFYFKQAEKRAYSQKVLLSELKERKTQSASTSSSPSAAQQSSNKPTNFKPPEDTPDAALLPTTKADDVRDHFQLVFEDPVLHEDVWGILALKLDRGSDKSEAEKIAAFYTYFLHPMFKLPTKWLKQGKVPLESLNAAEEPRDEVEMDESDDTFPENAQVNTPYGMGLVKGFNAETGFYTVRLSFGTGYLKPSVLKLHKVPKHPVVTLSKPVTMSDREADASVTAATTTEVPNFYSTSALYLFFRQYHLLYDRLLQAKRTCMTKLMPKRVKHFMDRAHEQEAQKVVETDNKMDTSKEGQSSKNGEENDSEAVAAYTQLLSLIYSLLSGSIDSSKFEDECRTLFGPELYPLYTVEKLSSAVLKQLAGVVSDDKAKKILQSVAQLKETSTALDLANVYKSCTAHLVQVDGTSFRFRFLPGVPKTPEDDADKESEDPLPFPRDMTIVTPKSMPPSPWKIPPRLGISLVENLPVMLSVPQQEQDAENKPITIPYPLEIDFSSELDLDRVPDMWSEEYSQVVEADSKSPSAFVLPVYKVAHVPASAEVYRVMREKQENSGANGDGEGSKKSTWFDALLSEEDEKNEGGQRDSEQVQTETVSNENDAEKQPDNEEDEDKDVEMAT